jgi:hypothetical protein
LSGVVVHASVASRRVASRRVWFLFFSRLSGRAPDRFMYDGIP